MNEFVLRAQRASYIIERSAGSGGTASVYKAYREDGEGHSRQTVALKILKNKTDVSRLRREFETLTRIRSPHCAQVLAWENFSIGHALVLEWIDGLSLADLARAGDSKWRLNKALVREIGSQVEAGLEALHHLGLHHGDLSPANILIDRTGCVRLVDFATLPSRENFPNEIIGTPAYVAPEIWRGQNTSFAADLFALAMIERDVEAGFADVPASVEQARARAFDSAQKTVDSPLPDSRLSGDPSMRKAKNGKSDGALRSKLAEIVFRHLNESAKMCSQTQVVQSFDNSKTSSWPLVKKVVAFAGIIGVSCIVTVRAQAPMPLAQDQKTASLQLSTHRWFLIQINGRSVGYAPVEVSRLQPGRHRLSWRNAKESGEVSLNLAPGERIMLTEAQLVQSRSR